MLSTIHYQNCTDTDTHLHSAYIEDVAMMDLAKHYGTPCYVYSSAAITQAYAAYTQHEDAHTHVHYAVKANSNVHILRLLADLGAGFDVVSMGELKRVMAIGAPASKVVFAGVGKSAQEIAYALEVGVACLNVESLPELDRIARIAQMMGKTASIALRINPDVDAQTHPYISTGLKTNKFGIAMEDAIQAYTHAQNLPNISIIGIDCHIGSQILDTQPFFDALTRLLHLVDVLKKQGIVLQHIDVGGGLGVDYHYPFTLDTHTQISDFVQAIRQNIPPEYALFLEPGRSMVAQAGTLLTKVEYLKHGSHKNFCIVDAAMNDLMRPTLYQAHHPVIQTICAEGATTKLFDVVGPVCETGDWLARDCQLNVKEDDVLAILCAGAYGFTMSSNYNTRPRAAEVLVDGGTHRLIRARESYEDLWQHELNCGKI